MTPHALADEIAAYVQRQLACLTRHALRGLEVPRVFAGHPVAPDVRADLAFTLGHLRGSGLGALDGLPCEEAIARVLRPIDGHGTHTFFSYRVAETLALFGAFEGNPITAGWTPAERENLRIACDSTSWATLLDAGKLPRNYAAVLARCELARLRLGLLPETPDRALLERTGARALEILSANPLGFLDDSNTRASRYDIYTADVYLFVEPLADHFEAWLPVWRRGIESALALVEATVVRNGAAVAWGRSTGALATCLTLELGALALARGLARDRARWLALAEHAFRAFDDWLDPQTGLINAHQHRSPYAYRGPQRRLQLTLDALGKLAWTALSLREVGDDLLPCPPGQRLPDTDVWIPFSQESPCGVWAYRSRDLAFSLPVVGVTRSDYLPAPRNPGLLEVPVDADLPTGTPYVVRHGVRYAAGHVAAAVEKTEGGLSLRYEGFPQSGLLELPADTATFPGRRHARLRVEGRTLHVHESLRLDELPQAVALQVAETRGRPLRVEFECERAHRVDEIDTDGLAEYRSFWAELPRVHQLDVEPAHELEIRWSVTPKWRVTSTEQQHHYHRSLYDPIQADVCDRPFAYGHVPRPERAEALLRDTDVFHLHWPEWLYGPELDVHQRFIEALRRHEVRIVWTQHNLVPHRKDDRYLEIYALWAREADAALHHSRWGEAQMRSRFEFGAHTLHRVIPHGHWGNLMPELERLDRAELERELGLAPCGLRMGIVGAPRAEKRTRDFLEVVAASPRDDIQLVVFCLDDDQETPDDPRIRAFRERDVDRAVFNRRLAALDLLVIPIEGGDYLTTGQFADAVGAGIPALISDWPFLSEMLGEAALVYGRGREAMARALEVLRREDVERAAHACRALQRTLSWPRAGAQLCQVLEAVGTAKL